jgi:hypothetical protein
MIVCEFCMQYKQGGECRLGLKIPKGMGCLEFEPGVEKFCSNPQDFVSSRQLVEMAMFFGIKGRELKKVKLMAAREESSPL